MPPNRHIGGKNVDKPLISVIIPVYNVEKYLDRCLESVVNQTYRNLEIILVDDGSPDNCPKMCDEWAKKDSRVVVVHRENGGASAARNDGLSVAKGDFITFVDSDDWIHTEMFEVLYCMLLENNADISMCNLEMVSNSNIKIDSNNNKMITWSRDEGLDYFFRIHGEKSNHAVWGRLIKKNILKGYSFLEGRMNEDIHTSYWLAFKCNKTVYSNRKMYYYFHNSSGVTNSKITRKKLDLLYVWDIVSKMVDENTPEYRSACDMNLKRARFTLLSQMFLNGYDKEDSFLKETKVSLKKEVRASFFDLLKWKMPLSRKILLILVCL